MWWCLTIRHPHQRLYRRNVEIGHAILDLRNRTSGRASRPTTAESAASYGGRGRVLVTTSTYDQDALLDSYRRLAGVAGLAPLTTV
jgi:hypothetical protein